MKYSILTLALFISTTFLAQRQGDVGLPKGLKGDLLKSLDKRVFAEPNIQALRAEDDLVDNTGTAPWRFGFNNYTQLNTSNSGNWIELANGDKIWFLEVTCQNALTINLTFDKTILPEGMSYMFLIRKRILS